MDCPLQNSVTLRPALLSCPVCDPFLLSHISPAVWGLSCTSLLVPSLPFRVLLSTLFLIGPGIRIFHLRKPTWQKASSSSAECSYYDLYLIHAFHSWRKLNEVHNLRYVLRWGRNLLNHEFHSWKIWFISKLQQRIHVITTSQYLHLCVDIWI